MELLVIKAGDDYFRFSEDGFTRCGMNKASVYPLTELSKVKALCQSVVDSGIGARLVKLTIVEEEF